MYFSVHAAVCFPGCKLPKGRNWILFLLYPQQSRNGHSYLKIGLPNYLQSLLQKTVLYGRGQRAHNKKAILQILLESRSTLETAFQTAAPK